MGLQNRIAICESPQRTVAVIRHFDAMCIKAIDEADVLVPVFA